MVIHLHAREMFLIINILPNPYFSLTPFARLLLAVVKEGDQEKMKSRSEGEMEKLIGCAHLAERYII